MTTPVLDIAAPESPPAELVALLREYERSGPAGACAEATGAYANCLAVSTHCAHWLRERGVACGLLHLAGSRDPFPAGAGRWPFCDPASTEHWTVRADRWSIDWTARQFDPRAPWPQIELVDVLVTRWTAAEDWACHRCPRLVVDARHLELTPAGLDGEHRALAQASSGRGPFPDPRHDGTPALTKLCVCGP